MSTKRQPDPAELERVAHNRPDLINAFVAYFVFEWQSVKLRGKLMSGRDQVGIVRLVPDYVASTSVDECLNALLCSPRAREHTGPGGISRWLTEIST